MRTGAAHASSLESLRWRKDCCCCCCCVGNPFPGDHDWMRGYFCLRHCPGEGRSPPRRRSSSCWTGCGDECVAGHEGRAPDPDVPLTGDTGGCSESCRAARRAGKGGGTCHLCADPQCVGGRSTGSTRGASRTGTANGGGRKKRSGRRCGLPHHPIL